MKTYLIILLINLIYSSNIILPFKNSRAISSLSNSDSSEAIYEYLLESDININLKIGINPQIIPMSLNLENKYIYIASNRLNIGIYDKDKSTTFKTNNEEPLSDLNYFRKGLYCNETFIFDNDNKIKGDDMSFILTTEFANENEYRKGLIGLQIVSYKQEQTFINQLKKKKLIDQYYFSFIFTKEDEGYFIIGQQLHDYEPKKFSFTDLRQVNTGELSYIWELKIFSIKYGETEFQSKNFYLNFNFGMISVGVNLKNEFYNDFFKSRISEGLCDEKVYKNYFIYSCINDNNKVKFNELKEFHFIHKDLEYDFVFNYNDLFIDYNNRKYFLLTYKLNSMTTVFGKPFFKKYKLVFNPDSKQIGHYIKEDLSLDGENNNSNNKTISKTILFIVIIIVLIIVISILGYILHKKLKKKKRKNELDENFDYIPEENEKNIIN